MRKSDSPGNLSGASAAPISFAQASVIVAAQAAIILAADAPESQNCNLLSALGRRLAMPLIADRDQPPFHRVTRDGFAIQVRDLTTGMPLRVIGQLRAGQSWPSGTPPLAAGEAIEIMTGAPLPPGADAVLMVEHAQEVNADSPGGSGSQVSPSRFVLPLAGRTLAAGENVVPQGREAHRGDVLLEPGSRLGPEQIALAASCGYLSLPVYNKPNVAILATGDELVGPSARPHSSAPTATEEQMSIQPQQIYDSNSHALAALVHQAGCTALRQRPARDRLDDLADCILQGLNTAPLLLLTGGVSMGKFDLVEEVLASMGAEFFFTGVRMQPGKPVVFGRVPASVDRPARYFFGLPGNPVSTMVTFRMFVEPLLAALAGERNWRWNIALAKLAVEFRVKPGLTRFVPAHLDTASSLSDVTPIPTQGSGDLAANARANCYLIVPDDCEVLAAGQIVRVLLR
ncbi:MAG: molybdopterin molybdotransferase MoeA [Acidobacteriaceae bacterium]